MQREQEQPTAVALTASTFDDAVLTTDQLVLVDFWTEWCGPCKTLAPILDELAAELVGQVQVFKVDADSELELARRFEVMSYPTLLFLRGGRLVRRLIGARGKRHLREEVSALLDA